MAKTTTYNENDSYNHGHYLNNENNLCPTCGSELLDKSVHQSCGWFVINYECPKCDYKYSHGESING